MQCNSRSSDRSTAAWRGVACRVVSRRGVARKLRRWAGRGSGRGGRLARAEVQVGGAGKARHGAARRHDATPTTRERALRDHVTPRQARTHVCTSACTSARCRVASRRASLLACLLACLLARDTQEAAPPRRATASASSSASKRIKWRECSAGRQREHSGTGPGRRTAKKERNAKERKGNEDRTHRMQSTQLISPLSLSLFPPPPDHLRQRRCAKIRHKSRGARLGLALTQP